MVQLQEKSNWCLETTKPVRPWALLSHFYLFYSTFLESNRKNPMICLKLRAQAGLVQTCFQATKLLTPQELGLGQVFQLALKTKLWTGQVREQEWWRNSEVTVLIKFFQIFHHFLASTLRSCSCTPKFWHFLPLGTRYNISKHYWSIDTLPVLLMICFKSEFQAQLSTYEGNHIDINYYTDRPRQEVG